MSSIRENTLIILRVLDSLGATFGNGVSGYEIKPKTGLSDEEYDQADKYLLNAGYIEGKMGGLEADRWLTHSGVEYLAQEMQGRMLVNLHAERLARYMFNQGPAIDVFFRDKLQQHLGLGDEEYEEAAQELCDTGLAEWKLATGVRFGDLRLTAEGRNAVRRNFRHTVPTQVQKVGAIIHGPVIESNIQAVAEAYRSDVQQIVSDADPAALREAIVGVVDELVKSVRAELSNAQLEVYERAAREVQEEVESDRPSPSRLQRLMGMLGFAGDLNGTLELGAKAIQLGVKAGPYLLAIQQGIARLLEIVG